jgi:hypothetical protein
MESFLMSTQERPEDLIVAWRRQPDGSLVTFAALSKMVEQVDDETGAITPLSPIHAADIDVAEVQAIVGSQLPALVAERDDAIAARDQALADRDAKEAERAEFAARVAELEAQASPQVGVVSRMQARLALLNAGLLDQVEAAVDAGDRALQIYWDNASHFHRDHPLLLQLAAAIGLTAEQVDQLFAAAAQIT